MHSVPPAHAAQVDDTVAEPESLKKLLITWLMCARLREREINHQPRDELLKWSLVFRLLSLVMASAAFAIRCTGAEMLYFHFPRVGNSR